MGPTGFDSRQKEQVSMPSIGKVARKSQFSHYKRRIKLRPGCLIP